MSNILEDVQQYVADKLNADPQLSACHFIAENKRDVEFEIKQALGKQGVVGLVMTPKATFAGKFEDISLSWQIDELEVDIVENVLVNRGNKVGFITGQDASMRLFDVLCPLSGENEGQFSPVSYEEGEDNNLLVNKCLLKCLVHKTPATPKQEVTWELINCMADSQQGMHNVGDNIVFTSDTSSSNMLFVWLNGEIVKSGPYEEGTWTYTVQDIAPQHLKVTFGEE